LRPPTVYRQRENHDPDKSTPDWRLVPGFIGGVPAVVSFGDGKFDFQQAADNHAARWEAMTRFYEEMGLLNR
jgi:hypothetical protein